jgi:hypothetical protein
MAIVNDDKTITMNHESEKVPQPIQMQYTDKNYLSVEPKEATFHSDKFRAMDKSRGFAADTYQVNSDKDSRSNSPFDKYIVTQTRDRAAQAYAKALELNSDVKMKYKDHVRRENSSKVINSPLDQALNTLVIKDKP